MVKPDYIAEIKRIHRLERLRNSANGNPRWRVLWTDGTGNQIEDDAAVNFVINNPEYQGADLRVYIRRGKVIRVEVGLK